MGVTKFTSTLPGGYTLVCSDCGISEGVDISEEEYNASPNHWDSWECKECLERKNKPPYRHYRY